MNSSRRIQVWGRFLALLVGVVAVVLVSGCSSKRPVAPVAPTASPASNSAPVGSPASPVVSAAATPTPVPPAATDLRQERPDGKNMGPGGWSVPGVVLSFRAPSGAGESLIPQVEVVREDHAFSGTPTEQGTPVVSSGGVALARITLKDVQPGQYRWQARFADERTHAAGPWTVFSSGKAGFGVVDHPPLVQKLTLDGTTHTSGDTPVVGASDKPIVRWDVSADPAAALDHLVYVADHQKAAPSDPPADGTTLPGDTTFLPLGNLTDGAWNVHLWAVDRAGEVSAPATLAVRVQRASPEIAGLLFRTWATNPLYQSLPISFTLSQDARVSVLILPAHGDSPVRTYDLGARTAGQPIKIEWDGKDARGNVAAAGSYRFAVSATDDAGNHLQALYTGLSITNKVIKVSLASESMTAYDGGQLFASTVVTTGGQELPTRPGQFEILEKSSPFVFHAQYPRGSPYWFPDVTSHYAMLYDQPDADFIHDAPWRTIYGPGTNGPGTPGQARTGSHGCVETPESVMARLYAWAPLGTPVIVVG